MSESTSKSLGYSELLAENQELKRQVQWFTKQFLNETSERSHSNDYSNLPLFEQEQIQLRNSEKEKQVAGYTRKTRGKTEELGDNQDSGLRFDDGVEIVTEDILPEEVRELSAEEYDIIGEEISDVLSSRVTKFFVHRRRYLKVKLKNQEKNDSTPGIVKQAVEGKIFANSYLSVGFIVDMFIDKCLYSIPLYRQHQRLKYEGFHLARSTLSSNFLRYANLLMPLMLPLQQSILLSRILAIDETSMKVGVDRVKHKMKKGYIWPVMGDCDQIIYIYHESRGAKVLEGLLKNFRGTLLSDGYAAYSSYMNNLVAQGFSDLITHATCWVHARRQFVKLGEISPYYQKAIGFFAELYKIEESLKGKKKIEILETRSELSKKVVDRYFEWLKSLEGESQMATNELLRKAVSYSMKREESMRVFLRDPDLALDTNYLEREIRPIAIGRKNFMFCWTEVGAESLCTLQSLIRTCLLQGINPREYLIDVIQRIVERDIEEDDLSDLIPILWKDDYQKQTRLCSSTSFAHKLSK